MSGLDHLRPILSKYLSPNRQIILMDELADLITGILQGANQRAAPRLVRVDATAIKVPATADSPAALLMSGFPNILHSGAFVSGGLTDGQYRVNVADAGMDFDLAAALWGTEKLNQWYLIYALAAEKVVNGAFATSSGWTWGTGWAHDAVNLEADATPGVISALEQNVGAVAGETYYVKFTGKNRTVGSVTPQIGGVDGQLVADNDTFEQMITATGTGNLKFTKSADFNGSLDDISVTALSFTLKAMPMMRFKSQAAQVISLGTLITPANGIGYGFATDELAGGKIYVLNGASAGLLRTITANNNNNATGGTITYSGAALTMAAGNWFVVLPPGTNFRLIGTIFNMSDGDIMKFRRLGDKIQILGDIPFTPPVGYESITEDIRLCCPLATEVRVKLSREPAIGPLRIGHPDSDVGGYSYAEVTTLASPGNLVITFDFCVEFCCYRGQPAGYAWALAYAYPPGCGF